MNISLIMLLAYLVLTFLINLYMVKKNNTPKSYFICDGGLPWPILVPLCIGELVGGSTILSNASTGFQEGLSGVWIHWGMSFGCFIIALLVVKYFVTVCKEQNVMTVPDAFGKMFDERVRKLMLVVIIVVYSIIYSTQASSAAAILSAIITVDETLLTWIISIIFLLLVLFGGMYGAAFTNLVHTFVLLFGLLITAVFSLNSVGGFAVLKEALPSGYFSLKGTGILNNVAVAFGSGISLIASPLVASTAFTARSVSDGKKAMILAGCGVLFIALLPSLIGMCAQFAIPDAPVSQVLILMGSSLSSVLGGLISLAVFAAVWSTAPNLLLTISTTITLDWYCQVYPKATDKQKITVTRIFAAILTILCTLISQSSGASIAVRMNAAFQIRSIAGIILIIGICWKEVTNDGAFFALLFGGIISVGWFFAGNPFNIPCLYPGMILALIIIFSVSCIQNFRKRLVS